MFETIWESRNTKPRLACGFQTALTLLGRQQLRKWGWDALLDQALLQLHVFRCHSTSRGGQADTGCGERGKRVGEVDERTGVGNMGSRSWWMESGTYQGLLDSDHPRKRELESHLALGGAGAWVYPTRPEITSTAGLVSSSRAFPGLGQSTGCQAHVLLPSLLWTCMAWGLGTLISHQQCKIHSLPTCKFLPNTSEKDVFSVHPLIVQPPLSSEVATGI